MHLNYNGSTQARQTITLLIVFTVLKVTAKIGSYESNNSTNGPFVFTGFKPAFILMKDADRSSMTWTMFDNKRNPLAGNPNDESLTPSGTAEQNLTTQLQISTFFLTDLSCGVVQAVGTIIQQTHTFI